MVGKKVMRALGRQRGQRVELRSCVLELEQRLDELVDEHLGAPYLIENEILRALVVRHANAPDYLEPRRQGLIYALRCNSHHYDV